MVTEVAPYNDPTKKFKWALYINGEVYGMSKSRFDADFAKVIIDEFGTERYERMLVDSGIITQ